MFNTDVIISPEHFKSEVAESKGCSYPLKDTPLLME
jgi:hypothetical protein